MSITVQRADDRFLTDAKEAGVDGLIVVDLPPEMDDELCIPALRKGISLIRLATPTTDDKRLPKVLTAGHVTDGGAVELGIDAAMEHHAPRRDALRAALDRVGIRTTYVGSKGGGPLLRLGTARARTRLAQSIGPAPAGVPPQHWPG